MFSTKDLTEEKIREIISAFVPEGAELTIVKFESSLESTRIFVKFSDVEKAEEFIRTVNRSSDAKKYDIKTIDFSYGDFTSFSPSLSLKALAYFLFF